MSDPEEESASEADLFRKMVRDVRPLKADDRADLGAEKKRGRQYQPPSEQTTEWWDENHSILNNEEWVEAEERLLYVRSPLPHATLRKFRKGAFCSSMEIDLHGLNSQEAMEVLDDFLQEARERRIRCFHLIHGKGRRSAGQLPVLKSLVNRWLRQRREVLAFCSAQQRDGGTGALYVLLKREAPQE